MPVSSPPSRRGEALTAQRRRRAGAALRTPRFEKRPQILKNIESTQRDSTSLLLYLGVKEAGTGVRGAKGGKKLWVWRCDVIFISQISFLGVPQKFSSKYIWFLTKKWIWDLSRWFLLNKCSYIMLTLIIFLKNISCPHTNSYSTPVFLHYQGARKGAVRPEKEGTQTRDISIKGGWSFCHETSQTSDS